MPMVPALTEATRAAAKKIVNFMMLGCWTESGETIDDRVSNMYVEQK